MSRRGAAVLIAAATSMLVIAGVGGGLDTAQAGDRATTRVAAAATRQSLLRAGTLGGEADGKGVVIRDVLIRVRHQQPVSAYVVRPTGGLAPNSSPGILFLHWLGSIHNDRTEYLGEAVTLAERGVVSVLPQGYFPWVPDPDGTQLDVQRVRDQVGAMGAALNRLVSVRSVDRDRIAIVGHDYGAMYGSLLADSDHRVSVLVLEAPDSTWGNWFATYWLGLEGQARDDYLALFAGLDPVEHTSRLGSHVLFQWAGQDVFITPEVQAAFAASSPEAQVLVYPNADHQLTDRAQVDRDAFLAEQLQLPRAPVHTPADVDTASRLSLVRVGTQN